MSHKTSPLFPVEPLNQSNEKYESQRTQDFNFFKSKSNFYLIFINSLQERINI